MLNFQNIVQQYFPEFARRHSRLARVAGHALSFLFFQRRFEQFDREYPGSEGFDFVKSALTFFDFQLRTRESERARIPATGKVVIVANHPIGSLDGLALLHLIRQIRPDVKVVANNMLMQISRLHPVLLPVDNMGGKTGRKHLLAIKAHLNDESALLIFPAGEVSRFGAKGLRDPAWQSGFIKLASATKAPIVPIFVGGRNSVFFYSLSVLAKPLSTAWLIREMFKQRHNTIDARIGRVIPHEIYSANKIPAATLAGMFKQHVYRLAKNRKPIFDSVDTIAPPESPVLIKREVVACERLGKTPDGKLILLTTARQSPCIMREIGRLREMTFRLVGEGSGAPRDIDSFDDTYNQLFLWDEDEFEIVGAYRLGDARLLTEQGGVSALYTNTLFDFGPSMHSYFAQGLELGRSFVQPKYQTRNALDYLWYGIGAYVSKRTHIRYLFGATSISRFYSSEAIAQIAHFYSENYKSLPVDVLPRTPFTISDEVKEKLDKEFFGIDRDEDFKALKHYLASAGLKVPTLYKHYSQTTEETGVTFCAFNRDPDFGDCVDGFVIADLTLLKPKKKARYLGHDWCYEGEQS
jgi:putative hemolysin